MDYRAEGPGFVASPQTTLILIHMPDYAVTGKWTRAHRHRDSAHEPFLIIRFALWKYSLGTEILYFSSTPFRY